MELDADFPVGKEIIEIIKSLECPICREVVQNVRELPCRHVFCANCLETYKKDKDVLLCPVCKREVSKRKFLHRDAGLESLCVFTKKLCDDFKDCSKSDIYSFLSSINVSTSAPDKKHKISESQEIVHISSEENDIIPCTVKPIDNSKSEKKKKTPKRILNDKHLKSSGPGVKTKNVGRPRKLEIEKNGRANHDKELPPAHNVHSKLHNSKTILPSDVTNNFRPQMRKSDSESILKWLHDTKNKFDRFSQTQYCVEKNNVEDINTPFDIPSVSQINANKKKNKMVKLPENLKLKSDEMHQLRRTKSAENLDKFECEPLKRHSLECSSPSKMLQYQNLNEIESIENKIIIDIIEDEVVDAFEQVSKDKKYKKSCRTSKKSERNNLEILKVIEDNLLDQFDEEISQQPGENDKLNNKTEKQNDNKYSKSSWKSISKFRKTIGKSKAPKKLDISLQTTQKPIKKDTLSEAKLSTCDSTGVSTHSKIKNKTVDFQKMEDYFTKVYPEIMEKNIPTSSQDISGEMEVEIKLNKSKLSDNCQDLAREPSEPKQPENDCDSDGASSDVYLLQTQPLSKTSKLNNIEYTIKLAKKLENLLITHDQTKSLDTNALNSVFPIIKNIFDHIKKEREIYMGYSQGQLNRQRLTSFSEKEIQTDAFSLDGFNITSTAAFKSVNYEDVGIQTDIFCVDCPHVNKDDFRTKTDRESLFSKDSLSFGTDTDTVNDILKTLNDSSSRNKSSPLQFISKDNSSVRSKNGSPKLLKDALTLSLSLQVVENNSKIISQVAAQEKKVLFDEGKENSKINSQVTAQEQNISLDRFKASCVVEKSSARNSSPEVMKGTKTHFQASLPEKHHPKNINVVLNNSKMANMASEMLIDEILEQCELPQLEESSRKNLLHSQILSSKTSDSELANKYPGMKNSKIDTSQDSVILYSLPSVKSNVNRKLLFEKAIRERSEIEQTLKRVRSMNSNSETDEERPNKMVCNRFIQDDYTIEFETESIRDSDSPPTNPKISVENEMMSQNLVHKSQTLKTCDVLTTKTQRSVDNTQADSLLNYCDELIEKANKKIFNSKELSNHKRMLCQISQKLSKNENNEEGNSEVENIIKKPDLQETEQGEPSAPKYSTIKTQDLVKHCEEVIARANKGIGIKEFKTSGKENVTTVRYGYSQIPSTSKYVNVVEKDIRVNAKENEMKTQDLLDHCNALIEKTTKKMGLESDLPRHKEIDNMESQIDNDLLCLNLDRVIEQANMKNSTQDKFSESMFGTFKEKQENLNTEHNSKTDIENKQMQNSSANDSFETATESLDLVTTPKRKCSSGDSERNLKRVKKMHHVTSNEKDDKENEENMVGGFNSSDDEMFSELDVVETTPQKPKNPGFLERLSCSQVVNKSSDTSNKITVMNRSPLGLPDIVPPPPGFGDAENDEEIDDDIEISSEPNEPSSQKESENIIPASLSPQKLEVMPFRKPLGSASSNTKSTVTAKEGPRLSQQFKQMSPISQGETKNLNVIEMVRQSKFSPLTILPRTQPSILTSTPKQKSILSYIVPQTKTPKKPDNVTSDFLTPKPKPCIAFSRLMNVEIVSVLALCNKKLATHQDKFGPEVTHMIVSVDKKNCVKDHTIKFISAIAAGIWVLNFNWIRECLAQNTIVDEEPYEVTDTTGIPSPRIARLTRLSNPLFKGFTFLIPKSLGQISTQEVENVIRLMSGTIASSMEDLVNRKDSINIILCESTSTEELEQYELWLETYKVLTVDIAWLSFCVSRYKVVSLKPHLLCGEDSLDELGYPPSLLADVPASYSMGTDMAM